MNKNSIILGLTGPTGAGKTTASNIMELLGCEIINADLIAKEYALRNPKCINLLVNEFGKGILKHNNTIKRNVLAQLAFSSKEKTNKLNSITHTFIIKEIKKEIKKLLDLNKNIIVIDAAVLFESNLNKICDYTICIICNIDIRLKRIIKRDNLNTNDALLRIKAQNNDDFYINKSDFVLNGNLDMNKFIYEINKLITHLRRV